MTDALLKALTAKEVTAALVSSLPTKEVLRCEFREVSDANGMQTFRTLAAAGSEQYPDAEKNHLAAIAWAVVFSRPSEFSMAGLRRLVADGKLPTAWHIEHYGPWIGTEKQVIDVPFEGRKRFRSLLTICRVIVDAWEPLPAVDTSPVESPILTP